MNPPSAFQKVSALGSRLRIHYSVLPLSSNTYTGLEKLSVSNGLDDIQSATPLGIFCLPLRPRPHRHKLFVLYSILRSCLLSKEVILSSLVKSATSLSSERL